LTEKDIMSEFRGNLLNSSMPDGVVTLLRGAIERILNPQTLPESCWTST